jgi:uncharacterized membrane protein YgdD (TMEM256/DUF423 family)
MNWIITSGIAGFVGVALGAFGAHGLRGRIPENLLNAFQTGVLYHLVHAVALFALALYGRAAPAQIVLPGALFLSGILLFSGSLYAMALSGQTMFAMVTPIGGLCFLAAWASLIFTVAR